MPSVAERPPRAKWTKRVEPERSADGVDAPCARCSRIRRPALRRLTLSTGEVGFAPLQKRGFAFSGIIAGPHPQHRLLCVTERSVEGAL